MFEGGHAWLVPLPGGPNPARVSVGCPLYLLSHDYTVKESTAIKY